MKYIMVKWMVVCAAVIILLPAKAQEILTQDSNNTDINTGQQISTHQPQTLDGMQGVIATNAQSLTEQGELTEGDTDDSDADTQATGDDDTDTAENEPQKSAPHN